MDAPLRQQIELAIGAATQFLARQRTAYGWTDFETRGSGEATDWITAYVLAHLHDGWSDPTSRLLERIHHVDGKLGFNERVPADSDSSALGMLGLVNQEVKIPKGLEDSWVEFLRQHICQTPWPGFSTYSPNSDILEYKRSGGEDFTGWTRTSCQEITGVVVLACSRLGRLDDFVDVIAPWFADLASRRPICSYWWTTNWYAFRVIAEACVSVSEANAPLSMPAAHVAKWLSETWCDGLQEDDCSAFALANYLAAGAALKDYLILEHPVVEGILASRLRDLITMQRPDGSWSSQKILRISFPWDRAPWNAKYFSSTVSGTGGILSDTGVFSTVTVLHALASVSARWRGFL